MGLQNALCAVGFIGPGKALYGGFPFVALSETHLLTVLHGFGCVLVLLHRFWWFLHGFAWFFEIFPPVGLIRPYTSPIGPYKAL